MSDTLQDGPQDGGVQGAQDQVTMQLINTGRCTYSDLKDHFDMTADGRERFVTPGCTVELWAAKSP
jgi:hypothetical protein